MSCIEIEGLEELERKLGRLASIDLLKPPMHKAVKVIYAETQVYPPPRRKPMRWKSAKQRRWFFANLRKGNIRVPYVRRHSGGLAGAWTEKVQVRGMTLVGIVGNRISYGPYVMHPQKQAEYHRGNWPTTDDITKKVAPTISKIFQDTIREALNA